jgi:hypothetical protein
VTGLNGIYLPMQLTDWLLVEAALLLIGLTQISLTKSGFDHPSVIESGCGSRGSDTLCLTRFDRT